MSTKKGIEYIESLYDSYNLFSISSNGRKTFNDALDRQLVYGDFKLHEIEAVFKSLKLNKQYRFIDFGSGAGKITLYAHYLNIFRQCVGIELVSTLYELSETVKLNYLAKVGRIKELVFFNRNFLNLNINHLCCVFTNSICFSEDTCTNLIQNLTRLKKGSFVISSKPFKTHHDFQHIKSFTNVEASWGTTSLHIIKRK